MNYDETLELLKSYTPVITDYKKFYSICGYVQNCSIQIWRLTVTGKLWILAKNQNGTIRALSFNLKEPDKIIANLKVIIPIMKNIAIQKQIKKIDEDFQ